MILNCLKLLKLESSEFDRNGKELIDDLNQRLEMLSGNKDLRTPLTRLKLHLDDRSKKYI